LYWIAISIPTGTSRPPWVKRRSPDTKIGGWWSGARLLFRYSTKLTIPPS
jgi:hypothetical protein